MKLRRKTAADTGNVSELRSQISNLITPEEAAQEAGARYLTIASGADALSGIVHQFSQIRADEEYTSAITQYETALTSLDDAFARAPLKKDEFGNPITDIKSMVMEEREARQKIRDDIRLTMKSAAAKREFDKTVSANAIDRERSYLAKALDVERKTLQARVNSDINTLLDGKNYDGAQQRSMAALQSGTISLGQFYDNKRDIERRRDTDAVFNIVNKPIESLTFDEIDAVISDLESGKMTGLSPSEVYQNRGLLYRIQDSIGAKISDIQKQRQIQNFEDLIVDVLDKQVSIGEIVQANLSEAQTKTLITYRMREGAGETSDPNVLKYYEDAVREQAVRISVSTDWQSDVSELSRLILARDNGLAFDDAKALDADLRAYTTGVTSSPEFNILSRKTIEAVTGFTDGLIPETFNLTGEYNELLLIGRDFQFELIAKAKELGPDKSDEMNAWVEEKIPEFRLRANNKTLQGVGVTVVWPEEGLTEELRLNISRQMAVWLEEQNEAQQGGAAVEKIASAVAKIQRLTGVDLKKPTLVESDPRKGIIMERE